MLTEHHIISVDSEVLKKTLIDNFLIALQEQKNESIDDICLYLESFTNCLAFVRAENWRQLFFEGYTNMLLDDETMGKVKTFFEKVQKERPQDTFEIKIVTKTAAAGGFLKTVQVIHQNQIDY